MQQQQQAMPARWSDLRLALGCLYSLPHVDASFQNGNRPTPKQAHDYLMSFQSRNIRRKLSSQVKRQRDTATQAESHHHQQQQQQHICPHDPADVGSTWLACIRLLCDFMSGDSSTQQVHYAEALFAAQTLVHRTRRLKLEEAIDVEIEQQGIHPLQFPSEQMGPLYQHWLCSFHPIFADIFAQYTYNASETTEGAVKGNMSMIVLSTVQFLTIASHHNSKTTASIRPLTATLGSVLAVLAARLRYSPISIPQPSTDQPIISMILQMLSSTQSLACSKSHVAVHNPQELNQIAMQAKHACLSAIPDALLAGSEGGSSGALGRLSVDSRCFQAINTELRAQGVELVAQAVLSSATDQMAYSQSDLFVLTLTTLQQWAKYASIPLDVIRQCVLVLSSALQLEVAQKHPAATRASIAFMIAVFEGGTWSLEKVLSASLIQSQESSSQPNKRRTSSRAKKRQQAVLRERTTDSIMTMAQTEVRYRCDAACELLAQVWEPLNALFQHELGSVADDGESFGESPVGCMAAAANAALPALFRRLAEPNPPHSAQPLFDAVASAVGSICNSNCRSVRAFAMEILYSLHAAVVEQLSKPGSSPQLLRPEFMDALCKCFSTLTMTLARKCAYPPRYFDDLTIDNEDSLEIERNEVRDVLRAVIALPPGMNNISNSGDETESIVLRANVALAIISQIMQVCSVAILNAQHDAIDEPALHAFSALAKPLNQLTKMVMTGQQQQQLSLVFGSEFNGQVQHIIQTALSIAATIGQRLLSLFAANAPMQAVLPTSRLYNLAMGSMTPMLHNLVTSTDGNDSIANTVQIVVRAAAVSLSKLPELVAPSTLSSTRYDIRGAMRSPGGEDHVGCLVLMRFVKESKALLQFMSRLSDGNFVHELSRLYVDLKQVEKNRGYGVFHGRGVFPKSRRILLGVICDMELARQHGNAQPLVGVTDSILNECLTSIAACHNEQNDFTIVQLCDIAECALDLASFTPAKLRDVFQLQAPQNELPHRCLEVLHNAVQLGFKSLVGNARQLSLEELQQWNRVRAASFTLVQCLQDTAIPAAFAQSTVSLIQAECYAITFQCGQGPASSSILFHEEVVSGESIPSGLLLRASYEIIDRAARTRSPQSATSTTFHLLTQVQEAVLSVVLSPCPSPTAKGSFEDPRPHILETWITIMTRICAAVRELHWDVNMDSIQGLLVNSLVSCVCLLLYPSLGKLQKDRQNDPGMSMDGPQTLALMEFLDNFFLISGNGGMMEHVALAMMEKVPIQPMEGDGAQQDPRMQGLAIIGGALFRAAQGGLPPWAVEYIPFVYAAFFQALARDTATFGTIYDMSMRVQFRVDAAHARPSLLAGRYFDTMSDGARQNFIQQAVNIAQQDNKSAWKRLKSIIKQACGGKKSGTDYNQRPGYTTWVFDRV